LSKDTTRKKCIHCGQLILRKISKIGATRCQILRIKYTKFDFRWGSAPDSAVGAYSAPPDSLDVLKEPTFKGRAGKGKGMGRTREREGEGRGGDGRRGGERKEKEEGRRGGCEHAPIGIFESRRLYAHRKQQK